MTARDELIEYAVRTLSGRESGWTPSDHEPISTVGTESPVDVMTDLVVQVVDAVLPQITTVAGLDQLTLGAKVLDRHGDVWERYQARNRGQGTYLAWRNTRGAYNTPSSTVDRLGPITVVWQPKVEVRP